MHRWPVKCVVVFVFDNFPDWNVFLVCKSELFVEVPSLKIKQLELQSSERVDHTITANLLAFRFNKEMQHTWSSKTRLTRVFVLRLFGHVCSLEPMQIRVKPYFSSVCFDDRNDDFFFDCFETFRSVRHEPGCVEVFIVFRLSTLCWSGIVLDFIFIDFDVQDSVSVSFELGSSRVRVFELLLVVFHAIQLTLEHFSELSFSYVARICLWIHVDVFNTFLSLFVFLDHCFVVNGNFFDFVKFAIKFFPEECCGFSVVFASLNWINFRNVWNGFAYLKLSMQFS